MGLLRGPTRASPLATKSLLATKNCGYKSLLATKSCGYKSLLTTKACGLQKIPFATKGLLVGGQVASLRLVCRPASSHGP
jgi:hypothetical protein